jgi:hypothetical protein
MEAMEIVSLTVHWKQKRPRDAGVFVWLTAGITASGC